ncbi:DUF2279 domain-containing protein [Noviherbaspirillum sp.]|jgi:hypothetical protein|uniref:DUF2279 domain-containing protein n=1 Tax=Noviherbaspirillum sp. TaxID=1926288 RepID=UPI0025E202A6|nr:DUF2279 domain-containing protein [Noviherbaspirillum sp.]
METCIFFQRWKHLCACLAMAFCIPLASAQTLPFSDAETPLVHPQPQPDDLDPQQVRRRTLGLMVANALAVGIYGKTHWWQDGFSGRFRTVSEGWFGQNTYSGGADKLGHFYMNYAGTRLFARAFAWAGNTPDQSLRQAAWLTLGTFTAVEVLDGFSRNWRLSKEDVIMNAAGVGAALLMEKKPELDRIVDLRLLYRPSRDDGGGFDPFGDYSGQTYLFVLKGNGIPALQNMPLMRYLEFAVGYGTRGYSSSPAGSDGRSRNVYAGISLNVSELLGQTVFSNSSEERRARRVTDTFLEFVQVPGTVALGRHRLRAD